MFSITSFNSSDASNISCDSKAHSRTLCGWSSSANRSYLPLVWAKAAIPFCRLGARQKSQITKHDCCRCATTSIYFCSTFFFSNQYLLAIHVLGQLMWLIGAENCHWVTFVIYFSKYQMSHFASVQPKSVFLGRWACWMLPLDSKTERSSFQPCYQFFLCSAALSGVLMLWLRFRGLAGFSKIIFSHSNNLSADHRTTDKGFVFHFFVFWTHYPNKVWFHIDLFPTVSPPSIWTLTHLLFLLLTLSPVNSCLVNRFFHHHNANSVREDC